MPITRHEFDLDVVEDMQDWLEIENDPTKKVTARIPFQYMEKDLYILKVVVLVDEPAA